MGSSGQEGNKAGQAREKRLHAGGTQGALGALPESTCWRPARGFTPSQTKSGHLFKVLASGCRGAVHPSPGAPGNGELSHLEDI